MNSEKCFHWPAEWAPHRATWTAWPRNPDTWPHNLQAARDEHAGLIRRIAEFEPVCVLAGGDAMPSARRALQGMTNVELVDIPTNDAWARDFAPTFVWNDDGQPVVLNWTYNAWGGKYPPFDLDQAVASRIANLRGNKCVDLPLVLEGGALEGNGLGLVLSTTTCVLHPNRNPHIEQPVIELLLKQYLGAEQIIWLPGELIVGDDTDGHIDQIARFVNETQVVVSVQEETDDPNHGPSLANWRVLEQWSEAHGRPLELVRLPMPGPVRLYETRLPASYANFYIVNDAVIVPQFDDPRDAHALGLLSDLFPDRTVLGAPSRQLVWGLGSFHCLTQQEPVPRPTIDL